MDLPYEARVLFPKRYSSSVLSDQHISSPRPAKKRRLRQYLPSKFWHTHPTEAEPASYLQSSSAAASKFFIHPWARAASFTSDASLDRPNLCPPRPQTSTCLKELRGHAPGRKSASYTSADAHLRKLSRHSRSQNTSADQGDFLLWDGNRPEDELNGQSTCNGFYDKPSNGQSEANSAFQSIWINLKHQQGADILSSLLASTMQERLSWQNISADSTYKLPPRVTLTDAKRETWLKGLAGDSTSLRSLSRSIPHGIRGKALLQHCLTYRVPLVRAIWLVKCVGANEIRASKRKAAGSNSAMNGEKRWAKDWTTCVGQFVDHIVDACREGYWGGSFQYGLRLVLRILDSRLLDCDYFYDWLIQSFKDSEERNIHIWLIIIRHICRCLIGRGDACERLFGTLLEHRNLLQSSFKSNPKAKSSDLREEVTTLLRRLRFLFPTHSSEISRFQYDALKPELDAPDEMAPVVGRSTLLCENSSMDAALLESQKAMSSILTSKMRALFECFQPNSKTFASAVSCMDLVGNPALLIENCLQWSVSDTHVRYHKIFSAAGLMRLWGLYGVDVEGCILSCLGSNILGNRISAPSTCHLLAQLQRHDLFSSERYCQWLLASGFNCGSGGFETEQSTEVRILQEMPVNGNVFFRTLRLRASVLQKLGLAITEYPSLTPLIKANTVAFYFQGNYATSDTPRGASNEHPENLPQAVKYQISNWLRRDLLKAGGHSQLPLKYGAQSPTQNTTAALRVLIGIGEFEVLADIFGNLISEFNEDSLTVALHICQDFSGVLRALGANLPFLKLFEARLKMANSCNPQDLRLRESFENYATLSDGGRYRTILEGKGRPLQQGVHSRSDTNAKILEIPLKSSFLEDFSSKHEFVPISSHEITPDAQAVTRIFGALARQAMRIWPDQQAYLHMTKYFESLKAENTPAFHQLMVEWVSRALQNDERPDFVWLFAPLICRNVLELETIVRCSLSLMQHSDSSTSKYAACVVLKILIAEVESDLHCLGYLSHRFGDQRKEIMREHPDLILGILRQAVKQPILEHSFERFIEQNGFDRGSLRLMIADALAHSSEQHNFDNSNDDNIVGQCLLELRHWMLLSNPRRHLITILESANSLDIKPLQLELDALLKSKDASVAEFGDLSANFLKQSIFDANLAMLLAYACLVQNLSNASIELLQQGFHEALLGYLADNPSLSIEGFETLNALSKYLDKSTHALGWSTPQSFNERLTMLVSNLIKGDHEPTRDSITSLSHKMETVGGLFKVPALFGDIRNLSDAIARQRISFIVGRTALVSAIWGLEHFVFGIEDTLCLVRSWTGENATFWKLLIAKDRQKHCSTLDRAPTSALTSFQEWLTMVSEDPSTGLISTSPILEQASSGHSAHSVRKWELISDVTPVASRNDASLNLGLFRACICIH